MRAARRRASVDFPAAIFPQRRYKVDTQDASIRREYHTQLRDCTPTTSNDERSGYCHPGTLRISGKWCAMPLWQSIQVFSPVNRNR